MTKRSPKETCSIQYSRRMSRGRNIQGVVHLQNQNYLCKGSLKYIDQEVINGHKNPRDSHNYHDENHDEIEFYLGNRQEYLMTFNTRTTYTQKPVRLAIRLWDATDQCTMSQVPISIPWHWEYWNIQGSFSTKRENLSLQKDIKICHYI